MGLREDYHFWHLAHYFITKLQYRIVKLSDTQNEIWLEKVEHKEFHLVRLLRYDLDWANWLQRDIERTALNGENIRRQLRKKEIRILTLYVTTHPPVDDFSSKVDKPFIEPNKQRVTVKPILFDTHSVTAKSKEIEHIYGYTLPITDDSVVHEAHIEGLKHTALFTAVKKEKEEKAIFQSGKPFFTYIFLAIQIIVFFLMELKGGSTNSSNLITFGAKYNPLILEGEWWRFFTPIVIHIGMLHLLMNSLALFYLGVAVERIFGRIRFLFIYIFAGFFGVLASFLFSPELSAGASGAIFGCFGSLLYFGLTFPKLFFRTMGMNIIVVIAINLAIGFTIPGIDNAGHIGGLIGGFLATAIVHFPNKKDLVRQFIALIATTLLSFGLLYFGFVLGGSPVRAETILPLVQEKLSEENYEEAYELLNNYVDDQKLTPDDDILLIYAFVEIKMVKMKEAERHLNLFLNSNPNSSEAYYYLSFVAIENEDFSLAKQYAEKAVQLEPNTQQYSELLEEINLYLEGSVSK